MQRYDFTPFYRSTVGFDHLFNLLDNFGNVEANNASYPPYNIERLDENVYRITMAVAGFSEADIDVEIKEQSLSIVGKKTEKQENEYLHQGIANRSFERVFKLADHVEVVGAKIEDGLLHVELKRELPEKMKPRKITVQRADTTTKTIEAE